MSLTVAASVSALTKPADAAWPYDIDRQLGTYSSTTVRKCLNEKALISFFLAKVVYGACRVILCWVMYR